MQRINYQHLFDFWRVVVEGVFEVKGGKIIGKSNFIVTLADYKIEIPSLVKDKISKDVKISVLSDYKKM